MQNYLEIMTAYFDLIIHKLQIIVSITQSTCDIEIQIHFKIKHSISRVLKY